MRSEMEQMRTMGTHVAAEQPAGAASGGLFAPAAEAMGPGVAELDKHWDGIPMDTSLQPPPAEIPSPPGSVGFSPSSYDDSADPEWGARGVDGFGSDGSGSEQSVEDWADLSGPKAGGVEQYYDADSYPY